ncbi:MAG: flavin reductase family protein, partial [Bacteroidales bacterium]
MKEIEIKNFNENVIDLIGKEWMLITAGSEKNYNTMTVSWGSVGFLWGKPVVMVYIRPQRYTLQFIDREESFSLSFFSEE